MTVKIKRPLSILLTVCMLLSLFVGSAYAARRYFEDAKGHWAEDAINILTERGIICGYPDGLVHPDELITRAEFAALVARTLALPEPGENDAGLRFNDLAGHWSEKDVYALVIAGMIREGDFSDDFLPNQLITRMEMIRILVRAIGKGNHDGVTPDGTGFSDADRLSDADKALIRDGKKYGIIAGYPDGTVRPGSNATRGEAFEMLVNGDKAKEQIKKEDEHKSDDSSGSGSSYVPAPQFNFTLPGTAYMDEEIAVVSVSRYVSSVTWSARRDGLPAELSDIMSGGLTADGGKVRFTQAGKITLIATAKNSQGKTATHEQTISVYPVVSASLTLPETAHTDTAVVVDLIAKNLGGNDVAWSVSKDGAPVNLEETIVGDLAVDGGTIQFQSAGAYIVTATITDALGKVTTAEGAIVVYPVVQVDLNLSMVAHTDQTVALRTEITEADGLEPVYTLTRGGEPAEVSAFIEGDPAKENIRFKERGVYTLTASVTDVTGRVFSGAADITVYPVGSAGFYLPEIFHTDKTVIVEAVFGEIGSHTASWSLLIDGSEVSLADAAEGTLDNDGGALRFKAKGEYVLMAEFLDDGGRRYSYEQSFKVYPVPTISYSLPEQAHTDSNIIVKTQASDLDGLSIEWLVDNTYGFQDWPTYVAGALDNSGGTIRFKRAGVYELVARVTDATGRVFLFEDGDRCEVFPVLTIGFELPELAYPDTTIDLRTHGNNNVLPVEWSIAKNGNILSLNQAIDGSLNAQGGKITFRSAGEYVLTASMTDYLGRSFSHSESTHILPVVQYAFSIPQTVHYGKEFAVAAKDVQDLGENTVVWTLSKDGGPAQYNGTLGADGGKIAIQDIGVFILTASITDSAGRVTTHSENITVTNTAPDAPTVSISPTRTVQDGRFFVDISASATDPDGDDVTLEYEGTTADSHYAAGAHTIRVRAMDIAGAYSEWTEKTFTVESSAPTVSLTATPTRTAVNGRFLVNINASASDADGDAITLEWDGRPDDDRFPVGIHTIKVRAKDETGLYSDWASQTFTITNSAPSTPVISRTPGGNSVAPGTMVTINATSSDPDGDPVTLVWEGRNAEKQTYPLGKNVVRVKAVDSTGAESPWAAIVFFVADSTNGGGMTLTGPDSVILENGLEGATITEYTFTVPPVSGHSGGDFGRVRGYNVLTGQWDQLDYGTTTNGITFQRTLGAGVYSKLEFYYYTNHDCMYGKSNITYSVTYHFE